jgi:hypothetical protein
MIVLVYPKYVGGKFISNCLALSKHCVVQDQKLALHDIKFKTNDRAYYEFKLSSVLKSLPETITKTNWAVHEFGCQELYGINEDFYKDHSIEVIQKTVARTPIFGALRHANKDSCLIAHDYRTLMKYLLVHTNAKIIEFKNFDQFRQIAMSLKSPSTPIGYNDSRKYHYSDQEFFKLNSYMIDVDSVFFEFDKFEPMMQSLYTYLGFTDYNSALMHEFYERYISLHNT